MTVLIAGGGIAGLTLGLTLHQIGVPFRIFEAVSRMRPLGVGINLQPTAVRELMEMGLGGMLDNIGVATVDYGFYTRTGAEIWTEPRGLAAGYNWPQYSVHRGKLQIELFGELKRRAGESCVVAASKAVRFENSDRSVTVELEDDGNRRFEEGDLLIGADGIHSAIRAQMYPEEGEPIWGGAILWRGTTRSAPFLSGASMILAGNDSQRFVCYPISKPCSDGVATINWIAELTFPPDAGWKREDWNRTARIDDFLPQFEDWSFDWLDVPSLIRAADQVYEYPMVDRDPVDRWTDGRVTLIGDAAHAMYPVGSNGASQAILDARILGAAMQRQGVTPHALSAYEATVRPSVNKVIVANRGSGPDAIMQMVEDRCGGDFDRMDEVISDAEKAEHAAHYKRLAGLDISELNARPPIIAAPQ